jgi:hypothetical protein
MTSKRRPARAASTKRAPRSKPAATMPSTRVSKADAASRVAAGLDNRARARRLAARSERAAQMGLEDLDEGAVLTGISEDIGALSDAAGALSRSGVERGMELAAMAGQIGTIGDTVRAMGMESLGSFLNDMSLRMRGMAVRDILESGETRELAEAIGEAGADVGVVGGSELAEGIAELASAQNVADASQLAAMVGAGEIAAGLAEAANTETAGGEVSSGQKGKVPQGQASKTKK